MPQPAASRAYGIIKYLLCLNMPVIINMFYAKVTFFTVIYHWSFGKRNLNDSSDLILIIDLLSIENKQVKYFIFSDQIISGKIFKQSMAFNMNLKLKLYIFTRFQLSALLHTIMKLWDQKTKNN